MTQKWLEFDGKTFTQTLTSAIGQLEGMEATAQFALAAALYEFGEYLLALIQHNINSKSGKLRDSGSVLPPRIEGDFIVVEIQWTAPYARIQDVGGVVLPKAFRAMPVGNTYRGKGGRFITRRQVNTARLFVPLREGVVPIRDPALRQARGYRYGVDYVLSRYVVIEGSKYMSNVLNSEMKNADRTIGTIMESIWSAMVGKDRNSRAPGRAGGMDFRGRVDRSARGGGAV